MTDRAYVSGARPRAAARHKLFEPVVLRQDGAPLRAHMLDLSVSGALLHAERPPVSGAHVTIAGELLTVSGRVVWMRGKRFGVRFELPITQAMVQMALRLRQSC